MNAWVQLVGGGVLLYFGAEWFVGGASALALSLRVPQLLVGLTVVAYGTSAPEIIVGVEAAGAGHGEVALGNIIGSNIANLGLILGVAALIKPARADGALRRRELPMLVLSALLVPIILADGAVSRLEGAGLVLVALVYTGLMVRSARGASALAAAKADATVAGDAADAAGAPKPERGALRAAVTAAGGLAVLLVGGSLFVNGAVSVAQRMGMSDRLVGLTIVAVGTSLPELVTSLIAAWRGHSDLAVGNVVGSNIFNVLACLGAAALVAPLTAPLASVAVDMGAMLAITVVAAFMIRKDRHVTRVEGAILLAGYVAFMGSLAARP